MNEILQRIKDTIKENGIKASDVQRACGIKPATWSAWFKNDTPPRTTDLVEIIKYLDIDANWLLGVNPTKKQVADPEPPKTVLVEKELSPKEKLILEATKDLSADDVIDVWDYIRNRHNIRDYLYTAKSEHYFEEHPEEAHTKDDEMFAEIDSLIPNRDEGEF